MYPDYCTESCLCVFLVQLSKTPAHVGLREHFDTELPHSQYTAQKDHGCCLPLVHVLLVSSVSCYIFPLA